MQYKSKYSGTEIDALLDAVNSGAVRTYKVYSAKIIQSGTNDPTVYILENTLDVTITWERQVSPASVLGTFSSALPDINKAFIQVDGAFTNSVGSPRIINSVIATTWCAYVANDENGVPQDTNTVSLEIRVYP